MPVNSIVANNKKIRLFYGIKTYGFTVACPGVRQYNQGRITDKGDGFMFHPCAEPIDERLLARACALSVSLLLDGAKAAGVALPCGGCLPVQIMPLNRRVKMVGTALTVKTQPGDNRPIHLAIYGAGKPGYALVIDGCGHDGCAYMGDLMIGACKALGFAGVAIDGRVRDWDGVMELGFPVYARGLSPLAPTKAKDGEVNGEIVLGGVRICPGDLVMGDCDGLCVIPREDIERVLDGAEMRRDYEENRARAIAAYVKAKEKGEDLPDLTPAWVKEILT